MNQPEAPQMASPQPEVGKFTEVVLSGDPAPQQFAQVQTVRFVGPATRFLAESSSDRGPLRTGVAIQALDQG